MNTNTQKFGTTFNRYSQFETGVYPENRTTAFEGVFIRKEMPKTPEDRSVYDCIGYFETYKQASQYIDFLFEKGISAYLMPYK